MRRVVYPLVTFAALAAAASFLPVTGAVQAADQPDRASLIGSWVRSGGGAEEWFFDNVAGGLHVRQIEGKTAIADFQCNTDGQNCDVKISGHKTTVSMYYNGQALVQLETKGSEIVKRRFSVEPSGNSMKVIVTPMTGRAVQPEELEFERGQADAQLAGTSATAKK
jgi:hypothetical protein